MRKGNLAGDTRLAKVKVLEIGQDPRQRLGDTLEEDRSAGERGSGNVAPDRLEEARQIAGDIDKDDGRQVHELKYRAKRGASDLQISLYFDAETFRHVGSQYKLVQPANMQTNINESSGQRDTLYLVSERFDDFRQVAGLTLPHAYKLVYTMEGSVTVLQDWVVNLEQVIDNNPVDSKYFVVE